MAKKKPVFIDAQQQESCGDCCGVCKENAYVAVDTATIQPLSRVLPVVKAKIASWHKSSNKKLRKLLSKVVSPKRKAKKTAKRRK